MRVKAELRMNVGKHTKTGEHEKAKLLHLFA